MLAARGARDLVAELGVLAQLPNMVMSGAQLPTEGAAVGDGHDGGRLHLFGAEGDLGRGRGGGRVGGRGFGLGLGLGVGLAPGPWG